MGHFIDKIIFIQEAIELNAYLNLREMTTGDKFAILHNHIDMMNCEISVNMISDKKK